MRTAWSIAVTNKDVVLIGMMAAVMEVSKLALSFLGNVELVTFWVILFTLFFGRKTVYAILIFNLVEGLLYGFGLWWFMYAYIWPLYVGIAWLFHKQTSRLFWVLLSAMLGFVYGALCSLVYVVIGSAENGVLNGLASAFAWWVAGIPFDLVHGVSNGVLMAVLYQPVRHIMQKMKTGYIE